MTKVVIFDRDFSSLINPPLEFTVEDYSRSVLGGALSATITAAGDQMALFELAELVRAPIEIYDEHDGFIWAGFIRRVRINYGGVQVGIDINSMSNNIAVAFTDGLLRFTTEYSENTASSDEYGQKDAMLSRSNITEADALQYRDTQLQQLRYPTPTIRSGRNRGISATIDCEGWLDTLSWRRYQNLSGLESYEAIGATVGREIGEDDRPIFAQAFQLSSAAGWTTDKIWIRVYKVGSPVDNFKLNLYSDSGGSPNASLASATLAGASVPEQATWTEFSLSVSVALSTSTTYWIHCDRSGAVDLNNYYVVGTNIESGYLLGAPKYYNTNLSAWVDAAHKGDLNFRVMGGSETTAQIATLVSGAGEFLTGSSIVDASGVVSNQYRAGDNSALYELLRLLETGSTNNRRMLCEVTRGRILRIFEEAAPPTASQTVHGLNAKGELISPYGQKVPASECIVGVWCRLVDVIPASVDLSKLSDPALFFIEESSYNAKRGIYSVLRARNQLDVFDIGGVK